MGSEYLSLLLVPWFEIGWKNTNLHVSGRSQELIDRLEKCITGNILAAKRIAEDALAPDDVKCNAQDHHNTLIDYLMELDTELDDEADDDTNSKILI